MHYRLKLLCSKFLTQNWICWFSFFFVFLFSKKVNSKCSEEELNMWSILSRLVYVIPVLWLVLLPRKMKNVPFTCIQVITWNIYCTLICSTFLCVFPEEHHGRTSVLKYLSDIKVFWKGMSLDLDAFIHGCPECVCKSPLHSSTLVQIPSKSAALTAQEKEQEDPHLSEVKQKKD